jgi:TonB family protein
MKPAQPAYFRMCAILLVLLFSAAATRAQFSRLDDLSSQIAKEVKPLKPHLIAVADFRPTSGSTSPQGHYFAWILSSILQDREKKHFTVSEHVQFDSDLAKLNLSSTSLVPGESFRSVAPQLAVDVLITGTVEKRDNLYLLQLVPIRISDSKSLHPLTFQIQATEFLDSFITPLPENVRHAKHANDVPDITMPSCIYCPNPSYSDLARRNRLQGVAIFEVLVSADGLPAQICPVRFLGNGLDEEAFKAIKTWRFKPAVSKDDGAALATIVPIEVSFRLY